MKDAWIAQLNNNPIPELLNSNPWTNLRTRLDLLEEPEESTEVIMARSQLESHPLVMGLLEEVSQWFHQPLKRHDDVKASHYQLKVLADFGFDETHPLIRKSVLQALDHFEDGTLAVKQALPTRGSQVKIDESFDQWHSLPCDAPLVSSVLYRLGNRSLPLLDSIALIKERWEKSEGWFCHLFFVAGQFKDHETACMMAGLQALELFSLHPDFQNSTSVERAFNALAYHRDLGKNLYYFGRSKKFWTMKYPFVWYNALYLAEILSRFSQFRNEPLVKELIDWILGAQDEKGGFQPSSMFRHYKEWDFANKKQVSPWMTYLCCKVLKQYFS